MGDESKEVFTEWVPYDNIPKGWSKIQGGYNGEEKNPNYVGRISHENNIPVGKVLEMEEVGAGIWYSYGGKEIIAKDKYQVLVCPEKDVDAFEWVEVKDKGDVPEKAVKGGIGISAADGSFQQGYIGRCPIGKDLVIGKAYPGLGIWLPYGGKEYVEESYQCLCYK